ncbi:hypothetical protein HBI69_179190 [Parastagonospora nodorum]|nr:hypothetical protein HBI69_179190 [Parastagonospora nodorum]
MSANIIGCLLVGSVPLANNEGVFRKCLASMPSRVKRLPDGETGKRFMFTLWQSAVFQAAPEMLLNYALDSEARSRMITEEEVDKIVAKLEKAGIETEYDTAAIESYAVFKKLRNEGVIPWGVRFQVGLPTAANVVPVFIEKAFQAKVWPLYEQALFRAMRNIQDKIPHHDLAIQLDLALESAFWEGQFLRPAFADTHNVKDFVSDYILRMIEQIDQDVELGIHNCYGDIEHKHFFEPKSLQAVVDRGLVLFERSSHPINFFHAPVPVSAMGFLDEYFAPLKQILPNLKEHATELYLGVVQYDDLEGTKKRIEAASKVVPEFGVATECGWGRTPVEQLDGIMKLTSQVCGPVV